MKLNPKERVLATARRQTPAVMASTFKATPEMERQLMGHFGLTDLEELIPTLDVCHLHWPWKYIRPRGMQNVRKEGDVSFDIWGVGRKTVCCGDATYEEMVYHPLAAARTVADVEHYDWPTLDDLDFSHVPAECEAYAEYALSLNDWMIYENAWQMRGSEQFLVDLAMNESVARAIIEHIEAFSWEIVRKIVELGGERFQFFGSADDFGTQQSLFFSVETWEKYFGPGYCKVYEYAHSLGLKTWLHSDGAVRPLIPRFIDAGLDILDPLMPTIPEMNPYKIVPEFGADLCFHGTIDVQNLLPFGSEAEVRDEVRRQIDTLWRGGGVFMAPSHCIQPGTPLRNILAVYEELNRQ